MSINLEELTRIYGSAPYGWVKIEDSKQGDIVSDASGASGGETLNGWKIHISIEPEKMAQAVALIAAELNKEGAPRVSIKFANMELASVGQASKQVAFTFYREELDNTENISAFLNAIDVVLNQNDIGVDPRAINSDYDPDRPKWDKVIVNCEDNPSRFAYRNDDTIVMNDVTYADDCGASGNIHNASDSQIWVKQSYYESLPEAQRHNPAGISPDPFSRIRIGVEFSNESPYVAEEDNLFIQMHQALLKKTIFGGAPYKQKVQMLADLYQLRNNDAEGRVAHSLTTQTSWRKKGFLHYRDLVLEKMRSENGQTDLQEQVEAYTEWRGRQTSFTGDVRARHIKISEALTQTQNLDAEEATKLYTTHWWR